MTRQEMVNYVAEYGGEFRYTTLKGVIQDIHYIRPESLKIFQKVNKLKNRHKI